MATGKSSSDSFLSLESLGGITLMVAAALAIIIDNSPLVTLYDAFLALHLNISLGTAAVDKPLYLWINDGLMAIFFLVVGLELKRELLDGELSGKGAIILPLMAAIGGMIVPAGIYAAINWNDPDAMRGWAIPAATDIAFALGVLALLGSRIPVAAKIFLMGLAVIDDLGAIIIIAVFYTSELSGTALILAGFGVAALVGLNMAGVRRLAPYILVGVFLWVCVLKSGVHATLAGVALGLAIPLGSNGDGYGSPLRRLENSLHPWVAFMVLPLFALANAGFHLEGLTLDSFAHPVSLGIASGLFIGKQIGVFGFAALAILLRLSPMPDGCNWRVLFGVSLLTGVGFTMSLFIGGLAFGDGLMAELRLGVLTGSVLSALAGFTLLRWASGLKPLTAG